VLGSFAGINAPAAGGMTTGGMAHFDRHWRGGSNGWWPRIPASRVNSQMGNALGGALNHLLTPGKEHLNLRLKWDCTYRDLNADELHFWATWRETGTEVWVEITSPRAPGGPDLESRLPNYGFKEFSDLEPGSIGPFTALGDAEVANYDGTRGVDVSFDPSRGEVVTTEGFRESWSLFPLREPVENGSQVLTGLSYTRDSWRPLAEDGGKFEDDLLHTETGYLLWDAGNRLAYRVIALSRGVTAVAVARDVDTESTALTFVAEEGSDDPLLGGIVSNPVLGKSARTVRFTSTMQVTDGGASFTYDDVAEQRREGQEVRHTDSNTLIRS
jgi:hypothetical protein